MATLQLKPVTGYHREELLDDDQSSSINLMFTNNNLTSIGNPHFSSNIQLINDDSTNATNANVTSRNNNDPFIRSQNLLSSSSSNDNIRSSMVQNNNNNQNPNTNTNENYSISFITTSNVFGNKRNFFWSRWTQFEKISFLAIILLTLIIFVLSMILLLQPYPILQVHLTNENSLLCLKPKCISISSSIIDSLDESINPCDDFYHYACGGWIRKNPLPDSHASWGTFGKLTQDNQLILKNVFEDKKRKFSDAERKAKIYYDSCMDRNKIIEKLKAKPMQEFIDLIGGWNISGGFDVQAWSLQSKLTLMHNRYNRGGLFEWSVSADEKDSTKNVLNLQQGSFIMSRDYYLNKTDNDEIIVAYLDFMTKVGVLLGGGDESSTRMQMKKVLEFERKISKILIPPEDLRDDQKTYHKMKLSELNKLAPFIDWIGYFREAFAPIKREINENESIVVYSPEFFSNLSKLIEQHLSDNDNKTILVNTIVWSVVQPMVTYLSKPFRDAAKTFTQVLIGSEGSSSQWRYCISDTSSVLGFAVGSIFVHSAFRGESKNESKIMIKQIKDAFKEHLDNLTWMDRQTLELAMEKADAITDMIGFPDFILNEKKLNKRYKDLIVKDDQYFKNSINANIFLLNEYIKKIDKPTNKSEWDMAPPVVNAYYAPTKNQIAFPAGILQPPFYDVNRPKALNFGAMGVVMGHELTHAFDDQGREYDKKGNLHEWWQHGTILKFKERMKCFQEQYSKYQIGTDHVNGKQTLGENVADNGGLTSAFHAFTKWSKESGENILLPGLNFTQNQLFFIGFAQVWCSVNTPEALKIQIRNDPHTPSQYRVIGTLSNSPQFSDAFNCPKGSSMNPEQKCNIW
uniref:Endothelin-converting enzyme homolog isoform X2 n=1 Tax=Dermatophagoides pteronyssinus TaxID=6956 RepID=A0A6P6Y682_DERPT|nr:endothelin-converting enzyme homolog isoform X2 [Dermatophagoides pteronyssinus]